MDAHDAGVATHPPADLVVVVAANVVCLIVVVDGAAVLVAVVVAVLVTGHDGTPLIPQYRQHDDWTQPPGGDEEAQSGSYTTFPDANNPWLTIEDQGLCEHWTVEDTPHDVERSRSAAD